MSLAEKLRIMVVDDTSVSRALIVDALDQMGVRGVAIARDGALALNALKAQPVHLVISDMNMPGLDGLALLKGLRQNPSTARIGFILVTGSADKTLIERGRQYALNNYVTKPFTVTSLRGRSRPWSEGWHENFRPPGAANSHRPGRVSSQRRSATRWSRPCSAPASPRAFAIPIAGVGGMNHFLLPGEDGRSHSREAERYGDYLMELLVNGLMQKGAQRDRLEAKLFGGARMMSGLSDIGQKNAEFAERYLTYEGIRLVSKDLGGQRGRRLQYWPVSGRARQSYVAATAGIDDLAIVKAPGDRSYGEVELF